MRWHLHRSEIDEIDVVTHVDGKWAVVLSSGVRTRTLAERLTRAEAHWVARRVRAALLR